MQVSALPNRKQVLLAQDLEVSKRLYEKEETTIPLFSSLGNIQKNCYFVSMVQTPRNKQLFSGSLQISPFNEQQAG